MLKFCVLKIKWPKSEEKVENGGRLGLTRQNFCPPPPKRAAGSASDVACVDRAQVQASSSITAFNAHVCSILELGSTIWSGAAVSYTSRLEKAQHKFLIWLAVNSNRPSDSLDYSHLLRHFDVLRINQRLVQHDLTFLHGVFGDRFNSTLSTSYRNVQSGSSRQKDSYTRPVLNVPAARVVGGNVRTNCSVVCHVKLIVCARRYPALICSAIATSLRNVCLCLSVEQCKVFILGICIWWLLTFVTTCAPYLGIYCFISLTPSYWVSTPVDGYKINTNTK